MNSTAIMKMGYLLSRVSQAVVMTASKSSFLAGRYLSALQPLKAPRAFSYKT